MREDWKERCIDYLVAGHHWGSNFFVFQHLLLGDLTCLCRSHSQFLALSRIFLAVVICKICRFEARAPPKLGQEGRRTRFVVYGILPRGSEQLSLQFKSFLKSAGAGQIAFWLPSPGWDDNHWWQLWQQGAAAAVPTLIVQTIWLFSLPV